MEIIQVLERFVPKKKVLERFVSLNNNFVKKYHLIIIIIHIFKLFYEFNDGRLTVQNNYVNTTNQKH